MNNKTKIIRMLKTARLMYRISKELNKNDVANFWDNECIKLSAKLRGH